MIQEYFKILGQVLWIPFKCQMSTILFKHFAATRLFTRFMLTGWDRNCELFRQIFVLKALRLSEMISQLSVSWSNISVCGCMGPWGAVWSDLSRKIIWPLDDMIQDWSIHLTLTWIINAHVNATQNHIRPHIMMIEHLHSYLCHLTLKWGTHRRRVFQFFILTVSVLTYIYKRCNIYSGNRSSPISSSANSSSRLALPPTDVFGLSGMGPRGSL